MKLNKIHIRVIGCFLLMASILLTIVPPTYAYNADIYTGKRTYFEGMQATYTNGLYRTRDKNGNNVYGYGFIFNGGESSNYSEGGSYSPGYVMPNKQSTYANASSNAGGAIGMNALNSYSSNVDGVNRGNKGKLYNLLVAKNASGTAWEKMGSALVAYQMIGKPKATRGWNDNGSAISVRSADWAELKRRLVLNDDIQMVYNNSYTVYRPGATDGTNENTAGITYTSGNTRYIDAADIVLNGYGESTGEEPVWEFRQASKGNAIVYALELNCANPLGGFYGLPDPARHSLTPSLSAPADNASVKRGQRVTATGTVRNDGPNDAGAKNWYITRLTYSPGVQPANKSPRDTLSNPTNLCAEFAGNSGCGPVTKSNTFTNGQSHTANLPYDIPPGAAPGTQICFVVSVRNPIQNSDNPVWRHSAMRCVVVAPPEYTLVPSVTTDRGSSGPVVEPGTKVDVTSRVTNNGEDESESTIWQLTQMVYPPNTLTDQDKIATEGGNDPCATFKRVSGSTCDPIFRHTGQTFEPSKQRTDGPHGYVVPANTPVGTQICFATSVSRPRQSATPLWGHSAWWCMTVGKKPKVQVWGGDVRSGSKINTSTGVFDGVMYGSWVEYAALSKGGNSGFASGAGFVGSSVSQGPPAWNKLTFANTGNTGDCIFGCYNFTPTASVLAGQFTAGSSAATLSGTRNLNDLSSGTYTAPGNLTLSQATISSGKTIVIIAEGTVTIEGSIVYEDRAYSSLRDIPQVIIRAPVINIRNSAGQVDAWLLAVNRSNNGVLNTCSDYGTNGKLTADRCNNKLTMNGPVVADVVHLRRTGGSEASADRRGEPAEVFNLRADAYLWGSAQGIRQGTSQIQTVYTKELSPRF